MNGLCPGVDAARAHLAVFGPGGYQPLAKLGDGAVPVLIKPAGCEVLPRAHRCSGVADSAAAPFPSCGVENLVDMVR